MEKKIKKCIVNGLTLSRIGATILMPLMLSMLSSSVFLLVIGLILFTDFLDGLLARKWGVSTIFGSLLDMSADKIFGISLLVVLSTMYPIMTIPLVLEVLIGAINIKNAKNGGLGKSSEIGRIKTWVMGLSVCSILLTGLSNDLLKEINTLDMSNSILLNLKEHVTNFFKLINDNKETIKNVGITSSITSEAIVATDYMLKSKNISEKTRKIKLEELKKNREFIKKIMFDEKYYNETKDMNLVDKLLPEEEKANKVKKLTLKNK